MLNWGGGGGWGWGREGEVEGKVPMWLIVCRSVFLSLLALCWLTTYMKVLFYFL